MILKTSVMMDINKINLSESDIRAIIKKFMDFIVFEGKSYVDVNKRDKYVLAYLNMLVDVVNEPNNKQVPKSVLMEHIFKDIESYNK